LIFLRTCCKKHVSKIPFYENVKMLKKGPFLVEYLNVIVGSFDWDYTHQAKYFFHVT
jgi:hypothetical protein